ncbi:hypothetical protein P245_22980 [Comamonas thiooxydans]|uniref:Uncharacterized protein n=1 Tax=Comamonas thiooxydans TaxID=363952 RepID=A0A0E3B8J4_9BURK|nr:hypothetical protein P245_22980 [Comamonas thiooxydans]
MTRQRAQKCFHGINGFYARAEGEVLNYLLNFAYSFRRQFNIIFIDNDI